MKKIVPAYIIICLIVCILCFSCNSSAFKQNSMIVQGVNWPDDYNVHINAHGGGILKKEKRYYWFGEHKTEGRKGNKAQVGVHCYSSSDLTNWKDEGIVLKVVENDTSHIIAKGCIIERPKVIYNKKNNNYLMWFHLEKRNEGYSSAMTAVAVSKNIQGPYIFKEAFRPNKEKWPVNFPDSLKNKNFYSNDLKAWSNEWIMAVKNGMFLQRDFTTGQMSRDMTLFVDENGKAYHIHAAEDNLTLHISLLNEDYNGFTDEYYRIMPAGHNEAPTLFKRKNKYYMLTSGCTGWEPNEARLLLTDSINGNWEYAGNPCIGENAEKTFYSQGTFVLPVDNDKFIFMADRWKPENPVEGKYIWLPIKFKEDGMPYVEWLKEWNINEI